MNKVNVLFVSILSLMIISTASAKDGYFPFNGTRITLYDQTKDIRDKSLSEKLNLARKNAKYEEFAAEKDLRALVLKDLQIQESDYVSIKYFGKKETLSTKVSELKLIIVSNPAGADEPSLGDIVLDIPSAKERGIVAIDKKNPFNNTRFDRVMAAKGIYWINPRVNFIEEISRTEQDEKEYKESGFENGTYNFKVQIDKKDPQLVKTFSIQSDSYIRDYKIYGGDILEDGSTLIYVSSFGCGFFVIVKDKDHQVTSAPCGAMGC